MKFILNIIVFFFLIKVSYGQRETENWYFGNFSSVSFKDNILKITNNSRLTADKGCSSISDKEGNLLFYTDGRNIYNKNHKSVQGSELLISDNQTSQNVIIIPKPESNKIFYIFTIKTVNQSASPGLIGLENSGFLGLYYSRLDISENNGLGKITETSLLIKDVSEKISAVHHSNGKEIWLAVLSKDTDETEEHNILTSILISSNNIEVKKKQKLERFNIDHKKGYIKFSPNAEFLAIALDKAGAMILRFDSETGNFSSKKRLLLIKDLEIGLIMSCYGVAFSQDSKKLYFHANKSTGGSRIYKFDVENSFLNPKFESLVEIESNAGALQLAKDGNIYNAVNIGDDLNSGEEYLSVIKTPHEDTFNFLEKDVDLSSVNNNTQSKSLSRLGLPNFIQSYFRTRIISETGCVNTNFTPQIDAYTSIQSAIWNFGDGNTSYEIEPIHRYNLPGKYNLSVTIYINNYPLNLKKEIEIFSFKKLRRGKKIIQCDSGDGRNLFNLTQIEKKIITNSENLKFKYYEKENDAIKGVNNIINPIEYISSVNSKVLFIKSINDKGCGDVAPFIIQISSVNLGEIDDIYTCGVELDNQNLSYGFFDIDNNTEQIKKKLNLGNDILLSFYKSFNNAQTLTKKINNNTSLISGKIWVRADTALGCGGIEPINLIVNSKLNIELQDSYTICYKPSVKPPVIISADSTNDRFEWRNSQDEIISINKDFTLTTIGEFSLTVYKIENGLLCNHTKTFVVQNPEKPTFQNIDVNTEDSTNNIIQVSLDGNSSYEFSLDNISFSGNGTSYTFTNVESGLRTVYVRDIDNCEEPIQTKVTVIGFKKFFTPNDDGNNDYWNIKGINPDEFKSIHILIFDRFGTPIREINDFEDEGWDGTYNGKKLAANNYWFKAKIIDIDNNQIEENGSFSLIR